MSFHWRSSASQCKPDSQSTFAKRIWTDAVWSKVIAAGLLAAIASLPVFLSKSCGGVNPLASSVVVKGYVEDNSSLDPLPGATISVRGESPMTTTDSAGQFELRIAGRLDRTVRLLIEKHSYRPEDRMIHLPRNEPITVSLVPQKGRW